MSILAVYIAFRVIKILDLVFALEEGTIGCKLDTHSKTSSTFSFSADYNDMWLIVLAISVHLKFASDPRQSTCIPP